MINLFDMSNGVPVPSVHCTIIPWLKRIQENFPNEYLQIYAYIFYLTCPDSVMNPYTNKPESEKEQIIIADLKPTFYLDDLMILDTIEKCKSMYETPMLRIWRGAKNMLDKMATILEQEEMTFGKEGNATDVRGIMKELPTYVENFSKVDGMLKEEQAKVRGNVKIPYHQMPGYKDTKEDKEDDHE